MNTIQTYWERFGVPALRTHGYDADHIAELRTIYYAGASAALEITLQAGQQSPQAFTGIMDGLMAEIQGVLDENNQRARARIATFKVPVVGTGPEIVARVEAATQIARAAAEKVACVPLLPWLIEAIQHALALGATEAAVRADVEADPEWWHAQMHANVSPERAAALMVRAEDA